VAYYPGLLASPQLKVSETDSWLSLFYSRFEEIRDSLLLCIFSPVLQANTVLTIHHMSGDVTQHTGGAHIMHGGVLCPRCPV
jgi:hypothetical protein